MKKEDTEKFLIWIFFETEFYFCGYFFQKVQMFQRSIK